MSTDLVPYTDLQRMAKDVVSSRMFPGIASPEAAMTLFLLCQSEGLHPMQAMMRYHVIQGRPAMKADAMLAEFMRRGGKVQWKEWTNEACEAVFTSQGCPDGVSVRWTMDDAKRAGVTNNPTWTKYPRQMLKARVASDGVRMADPAVNQGRYTPEEVTDMDPPGQGSIPSMPRGDGYRGAVPADAEILAGTSLDAEEKPLSEVLNGPKPAIAAVLASLPKHEHPAECPVCKAWVTMYESDSKVCPGRKVAMCSWAHEERDRLIADGMDGRKANAKIKGHYREWGEVWPRKEASDAVDPGKVAHEHDPAVHDVALDVGDARPQAVATDPVADTWDERQAQIVRSIEARPGLTALERIEATATETAQGLEAWRAERGI